MIRVPGRAEQDGARFQHTAQEDGQFNTYELLLSGISHFIFSDDSI